MLFLVAYYVPALLVTVVALKEFLGLLLLKLLVLGMVLLLLGMLVE